jgi:hypothetical protein
MTEDELKGTQDDLDTPYPEAAARFARAMWLSPRDCRRALRAAATIEVNDSPVVAHAVSRNGERYLSLTSTCRTLGYRPWEQLRRGSVVLIDAQAKTADRRFAGTANPPVIVGSSVRWNRRRTGDRRRLPTCPHSAFGGVNGWTSVPSSACLR